ncbi:ATP-dependent DNA helicase DinG [Metabacillus sp. RGM 3146]|uniref:ATP-dependent DNA helicase DinG n=1 Tax=Metabacillus sp. RGM 3146 TaxID=3401092 RepID=UPI003B9D6BD7
MKQKRFVVLDVETTGNSPKKGDRIIQFAAVVLEGGKIVDRFMSFVNPLQPIPLFIEQLTGISDEMVQDAPLFEEIAPAISSLLKDSYFVAHNVYFDLSFVQAELAKSGCSKFSGGILDTVELARIAFPQADSYKLSELCKELDIRHDHPHRADSDAQVTATLLQKIFEVAVSLPVITLKSLLRLSKSFISDAEELISDLISLKQLKLTDHSRDDLDLFRNLAIKKQAPLSASTSESVSSLMLSSKPEHLELPEGYTARKDQEKMMRAIYHALNSHQHLLLEAGTGTGKTLGYLLPSVLYALREKKRILVSTHTVTLQQQLLQKDIPALQSKYPYFDAALLKGQSHYISLQKFEHTLAEEDDNYDSILAKSQILIWLTETETGDRDQINLPSGGAVLWRRIQCSQPSSENNPWQTRCFYQRARQKAEKAEIVITNHSLLLADCASKMNILPEYHEVIIDEAHHFERIASEQMGKKLDYLALHGTLDRLGHLYSDNLLSACSNWMEKNHPEGYELMLELDVMLKDFSEECNEFFQGLHSYVQKRAKTRGFNKVVYRYGTENNPHWNSILELADRIKFYLFDFIQIMQKQKELMGESVIERDLLLKEYFEKHDFFKECYENISNLFFFDNIEEVKWIEIEARGAKNAVSVYAQPISVNELLADRFFSEKNSVVLTSATMSVEGSFQFIIDQLGLKDFYPETLAIRSPFLYKEQAQLLVPSDFPAIQEVTPDEYAAAAAKAISLLVQKTSGKMLVLFTSFDMLRKTYQMLKENAELNDYAIMGQGTGSGSRNKLAKSFRQFEKAILLGTSSFWEGVDFPGSELTSLMIVRLPFSPPDDPIVSAKCEKLASEGKNAFYHYSLPEAVIRFRQGFGRLIRSTEDRGIVYVLDRRLTAAKYGKYFIESIPEVPVMEKPLLKIAELTQNFFFRTEHDHEENAE